MVSDQVPGGNKTAEELERERYESWLFQERARLLEEEQGQDYVKKNEKGMFGLFAKHNFESGQTISQYLIGKNERRYNLKYLQSLKPGDYGYRNGIQIEIDGEGKGLYVVVPNDHPRNFVNHSCDPNAGIRIVELPDGTKNSLLVATGPIGKDKEITVDYSTLIFETWNLRVEECLCGSPNCRHKIEEFLKLPKALQDKYLKLKIIPEFIIKLLARKTGEQTK